MECCFSLDNLITLMREREITDNVKYAIRRATKGFGDDGMYFICSKEYFLYLSVATGKLRMLQRVKCCETFALGCQEKPGMQP